MERLMKRQTLTAFLNFCGVLCLFLPPAFSADATQSKEAKGIVALVDRHVVRHRARKSRRTRGGTEEYDQGDSMHERSASQNPDGRERRRSLRRRARPT